MSQSPAAVLLHVVFSTKNRAFFLQAAELRSDTHAYLGGILRNLNCSPVQIGGVADHVHILLGLSRSLTIADLIKNLKVGSTTMIKDTGLLDFAWQAGYGVFSVSESTKDSVFPISPIKTCTIKG